MTLKMPGNAERKLRLGPWPSSARLKLPTWRKNAADFGRLRWLILELQPFFFFLYRLTQEAGFDRFHSSGHPNRHSTCHQPYMPTTGDGWYPSVFLQGSPFDPIGAWDVCEHTAPPGAPRVMLMITIYVVRTTSFVANGLS
jgi:hypothetical protein